MNRTLGTPIHHSNLEHGATYYLKTKFGEGVVKTVEQTFDGWDVEVVDGCFRPPLRKFTKGQTMLVKDDHGSFYEIEG